MVHKTLHDVWIADKLMSVCAHHLRKNVIFQIPAVPRALMSLTVLEKAISRVVGKL